MTPKIFAERLHQGLDAIDFPSKQDERVEALAKLIKIPKFKAEALLNGAIAPDPEALERIATELEVSAAWLTGESEARK